MRTLENNDFFVITGSGVQIPASASFTTSYTPTFQASKYNGKCYIKETCQTIESDTFEHLEVMNVQDGRLH